MGTEIAFGEADGFAHGVEAVEFERVDPNGFADGLHQVGVLLGALVAVSFDIAHFSSLKLGDDTACDDAYRICNFCRRFRYNR